MRVTGSPRAAGFVKAVGEGSGSREGLGSLGFCLLIITVCGALRNSRVGPICSDRKLRESFMITSVYCRLSRALCRLPEGS